MMNVRPPAVSGVFYPEQPQVLTTLVDELLRQATTDVPAPRALIAPHAGYVYSGATAAAVYARVKNRKSTVSHVVLLGPDHRVGFAGIAAPEAEFFATPLGQVPLAVDSIALLVAQGLVKKFAAAHELEHSLEVQLPFLQTVLDGFDLIPLVVGQVEPGRVAAVIDRFWEEPQTLIVISSDLSHFLTYEQARRVDQATTNAIERLDEAAIGTHDACGAIPVRGLLQVVRKRGARCQTVALCNSGDRGAPRDRVVGYGAYVFD